MIRKIFKPNPASVLMKTKNRPRTGWGNISPQKIIAASDVLAKIVSAGIPLPEGMSIESLPSMAGVEVAEYCERVFLDQGFWNAFPEAIQARVPSDAAHADSSNISESVFAHTGACSRSAIRDELGSVIHWLGE